MQAAILGATLRSIDEWNAVRRTHAELYGQSLHDTSIIAPAEMEYRKHCYHLYAIRSDCRDELQKGLRERGAGALVHYPVPVHLQEAYRDLGVSEGTLPVTVQLARQVPSLPVASELSEEQIRTVCDIIAEFQCRESPSE